MLVRERGNSWFVEPRSLQSISDAELCNCTWSFVILEEAFQVCTGCFHFLTNISFFNLEQYRFNPHHCMNKIDVDIYIYILDGLKKISLPESKCNIRSVNTENWKSQRKLNIIVVYFQLISFSMHKYTPFFSIKEMPKGIHWFEFCFFSFILVSHSDIILHCLLHWIPP